MSDWLHFLSIPIVLVAAQLLKNYKKSGETNIIRQPKIYFSAGIFMALTFSMIALLFGLFPSEESREYVLAGVIVLLCFSMIGVFLIIWYLNFKIEFDQDNLIHTNIFKNQKIYKLKDLNYDSHLSKKDIYKSDKIVLTVNDLMENGQIITDKLEIRKYHKNSIGTIKGNANAKGFGITFILLGMLCVMLFLMGLFYSGNNSEIIVSYIFLIIGTPMFCFGFFLILFRFIFKIRIDDSIVKVTNIFGITKTYSKKDLKYIPTNHGSKIYYGNIKILYINDNFTEESKLVFVLDRKK